MKCFFFLWIVLFSMLSLSCQGQSGGGGENRNVQIVDSSHFPYVLKANATYKMPQALQEISGITFLNKKQDILYAIQDEDGILFSYDLKEERIVSQTTFGKKGDYEEITTDGEYFYVLRSDGHIYRFGVRENPTPESVSVYRDLVPKGEYESMSFDSSSNSLYLLCKACKSDKKAEAVSGYILKIVQGGDLVNTGTFALQISALSSFSENIKKTFKPSAMARRNSTSEWYIVSSIDQTLVITDNDFNPKMLVDLPRKDFEQPEGIAFDQHENLYISSEAGTKEHGLIYRFNLQK